MTGRSKSRNYRDIDGILILDKPTGLSSNRALQRVRAIFQARKAGHCGSLDPLATGVLPICLGQATKFSDYLLGANKTYRAVCRLGQVTTTGDTEGEIIDQCPVDTDRRQIESILTQFRGPIEQIPPMYSALKHQGRRLYQLAREGIQVERQPRQVDIRELKLLKFEDPHLEIEVCCSKGTYIRTLAEDIGAALGCGAHISELRRIAVDRLDQEDALTLETIQQRAELGLESLNNLLLPVSSALMQFPELVLNVSESEDLSHGKRVNLESPMAPGLYRLRSSEGCFVGLGEVFPDAELAPKRLMNTAR